MGLLGKRTIYADGIKLILGTGGIALGIQWFYDTGGFVTGGFTGIAIMIRQTTLFLVKGGVPLWLTNLLLNIPVFLAALRIKGRRFVAKTAAATFMLSGWLYVIPALTFRAATHSGTASCSSVLSQFSHLFSAGPLIPRLNTDFCA